MRHFIDFITLNMVNNLIILVTKGMTLSIIASLNSYYLSTVNDSIIFYGFIIA